MSTETTINYRVGASHPCIDDSFSDGPWVDMLEYLNIPTVRGTLYGGVRISSLDNTIAHILGDSRKMQLMVLIKSVTALDEEILARFQDPTGEIDGYFHRDLVEQLGTAFIAGAGLLLRNVSVLRTLPMTPITSGIGTYDTGGAGHCFLNIIPSNLARIFVPCTTIGKQELASVLRLVLKFHSTFDEDSTVNDESQYDDGTCDTRFKLRVFAEDVAIDSDMLVTTAKEITFLSQRQVIQPNHPATGDHQKYEDNKRRESDLTFRPRILEYCGQAENFESMPSNNNDSMNAAILQLDATPMGAESMQREVSYSEESMHSEYAPKSSDVECVDPDESQAIRLLNSELEEDW